MGGDGKARSPHRYLRDRRMISPIPRCIICNTLITTWARTQQRPLYCTSPTCRAEGRRRPICARCRKPLKREHFSQKYHKTCRNGCHTCGKKLTARKPLTPNVVRYQHMYCSVECQDKAWEGQPLPLCSYCTAPVPLPRPPRAMRDPAASHHRCRPTHLKKEDDES